MDNTNFRIIGLDPGGTTGWATYTALRMSTFDGKSARYEYLDEKWDCGQLGTQRHHSDLDYLLDMFEVEKTIIVCESFEYRNAARVGLELVSKEYIGVVELFQQKHPQVELHYQSASQGKITKKSFVQKENLEKLGLYVSGNGHAMDAYGHILYYMIDKRIRREYLLEKGWK